MSGYDEILEAAGVLQDALDMLDGITPRAASVAAGFAADMGVFCNVDFDVTLLVEHGLTMVIEGVEFDRAKVYFRKSR